MIIDNCVCKLKSGIIEVWAPPTFNILTKRKITVVMERKAANDKRFKAPQAMTIKPL